MKKNTQRDANTARWL